MANSESGRTARVRLPRLQKSADTLAVWQRLARGADGSVVAGVQRTEKGPGPAMMGGKSRLILIRVTAHSEAIVLDIPVNASLSRPCVARPGRPSGGKGCRDLYSFGGV